MKNCTVGTYYITYIDAKHNKFNTVKNKATFMLVMIYLNAGEDRSTAGVAPASILSSSSASSGKRVHMESFLLQPHYSSLFCRQAVI